MDDFNAALSLHFSPLISQGWIIALIVFAGLVLLVNAWKNRRALLWRVVAFTALLALLFNPLLIKENRKPVPDIVSVVVDQSPSQDFGLRAGRTEKALAYLRDRLEGREDIRLRVIKAPAEKEAVVEETRLFEKLDQALSDVPQSRRAGVFMITDGQVHDLPQSEDRYNDYGPVHVLLSGKKDERDRRLVVTNAPAYGIVGQDVTVKYRIEDTDNIGSSVAFLNLKNPNGEEDRIEVPVNQEQSLTFTLEHAGQNVVELEAENVPGELTKANNQAALLINGVRDRLRVLLVSGQPHAGGRTWRDLLKSDPSVDLVHFTILREPEKLDATPQRELSLIAFPFRELFEIKLYDFDLIIFDRYKLNNVVPDRYFSNIVKFVKQGGALLAANGPDYATQRSLYYTPLADVLPSVPSGSVMRRDFKPALTGNGLRHPVTRELVGFQESWGSWLRQVDIVSTQNSDILMQGVQNKPLLLLDRVGKGRVAQFTSDHIWLWSRGYDGGGPYAELLRRVVHWLMKEPELDERALDVQVDGTDIRLRAADYGQADGTDGYDVTVIEPDRNSRKITLKPTKDGWLQYRFKADQLGVYGFETEDGQRRYAVVGNLNPPELSGVRTTESKLLPVVKATGGGMVWLSENENPAIRFYDSGYNTYAGRSWLGVRQNNSYTVAGVQGTPLLPGWLALLIMLLVPGFTWWREGRT